MFHHAIQPAQLHNITHSDRIFKQQENPGDDILHQPLGTKTNRNADHPGTRNQWRDIHADFRQHRQHDENQDHCQQRGAQHGQQCAYPRTLRCLGVA